MEIIAPSGKFWIAIPIARARAADAEIWTEPVYQPAYKMPTAIPSGILWRVTASTIIVDFLSLLLGPSTVSLMCICGVSISSRSKKSIPRQNPTTAGIKASFPIPNSSAWLIEGIKRLQTDAATMTPAANPESDFCRRMDILFFIKKTQAEPRVVPKKGISKPFAIVENIFHLPIKDSWVSAIRD